jgi:EAL domain-containing protein (putative c-di-GMP-specific phosphodiesterase class I)
VDRAFINDITVDEDDAAIVRAIIGLGHNLDLKLVAEGVETQAQLEFLRTAGCDLIQGFVMSEAVPGDALVRLLGATASRPAHEARQGEAAAHGVAGAVQKFA